ncbi:MAG TPA: ATP-dependent helicase HrpB [Spirochaetota bacterium]|nr:ATP-dependent helicase HrpB [Spirochaetota bacterium]HPI22309.1 ATP-dependent helicase HrpB [Spirochaetota bacterium]
MSPDDIAALPIYPHLDEIAETLARHSAMLLHAEPGAGKTTLVPWRLLQKKTFRVGKIALLQPRRIAARAAAERIAALLGEEIGSAVGLRTRMETIAGPAARLEVMTEGVLVRIIQGDQSLGGYGTIIFDEFHERSLVGDLGIALAIDCKKHLRSDLRFLFMSATMNADALRDTLGDVPHRSIPGRAHPVEIRYSPPRGAEAPWDAAGRLALEALREIQCAGDVLVFLPGFREIRRAREACAGLSSADAEIMVLHGRVRPEEQRAVLRRPETGRRRIILATNVAETSLTIPGIQAVVDLGLERRVRFSPRTGMGHWETVPISAASAEQRAGRAGRLGPGLCLRWWDSRESRSDFAPPEIAEADLAPLVLECAHWGAPAPSDLAWITPPPEPAVRRAQSLLSDLGFLDGRGRITDAGRRAARVGAHPRFARMLFDGIDRGAAATAAIIAAIIEEGDPLPGADVDLRTRLDACREWLTGSRGRLSGSGAGRIADAATRLLSQAGVRCSAIDAEAIDPNLAGLLLLGAYPDRAARKTRDDGPARARLVLAGGRGATVRGALAAEEFLAIAEIDGGESDGRVMLAAPIARADLEGGAAGPVRACCTFEWRGWTPAVHVERRVGALVLSRQSGGSPAAEELQRAVRERIMREGIQSLPWGETSWRLCARCRFVHGRGVRNDWPDFSDDALSREVDSWLVPHGTWSGGPVFDERSIVRALEGRLGWENRRLLDDIAPEIWTLPSGSRRPIDYTAGDIPVLAARLQEFFGSVETPRLCGEPIILHLLSPAGRPVQITRDLDGFWDRAYPEVKKELRGRYPRHFWPDDPRAAAPTARAKPRK